MSTEVLRLIVFAAILTSLMVVEHFAPWRGQAQRLRRWPSNLGVLLIDSALVRLVFPVTAAGFAELCALKGWGLFNLLAVPGWIAFVLSAVALDLAIYLQHRVFHHVPALWRLHRMHHADTMLDATSGTRFHPLEILLSMAIKLAAIAVLGAPAAAVILFEILLNATAMFNHANIVLPTRADRVLRWFLVTPDMHRVHHSSERIETDSNFGFSLPWWDYLFKTYNERPEKGLDGMEIGLEVFRDPGEQRLDRMLTQPFRDP
ncbi:MAG TPA: sterol desaturase family protein [Beijerinckiaceae bacterium]|nr:sterol desaturase family protein [Beijerinckiaceae bacterium]